MKIYQLVAKGPLALAPGQVFRHSSREIFLDREEAEKFVPTFTALMTQSQDSRDIAYLDPVKTEVKVSELTIAGIIEQEDLGVSVVEIAVEETPAEEPKKKAPRTKKTNITLS